MSVQTRDNSLAILSLSLYQCVLKVSVLIFYLIIYWTYLKLQVISFKV
jgi:hypothetical protein